LPEQDRPNVAEVADPRRHSLPHGISKRIALAATLAKSGDSQARCPGTQSAGANAAASRLRTSRSRIGRTMPIIKNAATTSAKAATKSVVNQLPVLSAITLPRGTKRAAQPLAVYRSA